MRKYCMLLGIVAVVLATVSCPGVLNSPAGPGGQVDSPAIPAGMIRVLFSLPEDVVGSRNLSRSGSGVDPLYLVCVNVRQPDQTPVIIPILEGSLSLDLPKNGIYVAGIFERRDGQIERLGDLAISSVSLNSLPVSASAQDSLDLGTLNLVDSTFISSLPGSAVASGLGYDENLLRGFGAFDRGLSKFLNPDINRNGVFDHEEGLWWNLGAMHYFGFGINDFDFETSAIAPAYQAPRTGFQYVLNLDPLSGYPIRGASSSEYEDIRMFGTLDVGSIKEFRSNWVSDNQVYFQIFNEPIDDLPMDGTFDVELPKAPELVQELRIQDARFTRPEGQGMVLPIVRISVNEGGRLTRIRWKWMVRDGETFRPATGTEVQLRIKRMHFSWYVEGQHGSPVFGQVGGQWWNGGQLGLCSSSYDSSTASTIGQFFLDFTDIADNYCKINFYDPYIHDPEDYFFLDDWECEPLTGENSVTSPPWNTTHDVSAPLTVSGTLNSATSAVNIVIAGTAPVAATLSGSTWSATFSPGFLNGLGNGLKAIEAEFLDSFGGPSKILRGVTLSGSSVATYQVAGTVSIPAGILPTNDQTRFLVLLATEDTVIVTYVGRWLVTGVGYTGDQIDFPFTMDGVLPGSYRLVAIVTNDSNIYNSSALIASSGTPSVTIATDNSTGHVLTMTLH